MLRFSRILKFSELMRLFRGVKRTLFLLEGETDRQENDMEHSYQLAMSAWYIASTNKLKLDLNLLIGYALIHDIVESYAGDTYIYEKDGTRINSKKQREEEAATRLKKEFPEFEDLHQWLKRYEERSDNESKFIYALDKVIPVINIYVDKGHSWKKLGVTLKMLTDHKNKKVKISPPAEKYWKKLVALLKKEEKKLFPKKSARSYSPSSARRRREWK